MRKKIIEQARRFFSGMRNKKCLLRIRVQELVETKVCDFHRRGKKV